MWVVFWNLGFNTFYINNFINAPTLPTNTFSPSLQNNYFYGNWISSSSLSQTQLQSLPNGTIFSFCFDCTQNTIGGLDQTNPLNFNGESNYWVINGSTNVTWFTPFYYNFYNYGNNSVTTTAQPLYPEQAYVVGCPYFESNCNLITWIDTYGVSSLSQYNVTSNTTNNQTLIASVSLNPTDLWGQITLMFGFISGMNTFSSGIWELALINFALFMTFLYCIIGEILIPFGIKIPFV